MITDMEDQERAAAEDEEGIVGSVIDASITDDVIKIKITTSPEDIEIGVPYVIDGEKYMFFCMATNIVHDTKPIIKELANTRIFDAPIQHTREDAGALQPVQFPSILELSCLKVIPMVEGAREARGFKTIPKLFSKARVATADDIAIVTEGIAGQGHTIGMIGKFVGADCNVPIDLTAMFETPFGIFGKTGKGKTVTAKSLVIMAIASECVVNDKPVQFVIFDAMSEYARGAGRSGSTGLVQILPSKIYQLSIDYSTDMPSTIPLYIDPSKLSDEDWINAMWDCTPNMAAIIREFEKARKKDRREHGERPETADLAAYLHYIYDNPEAFDALKGDRPERYPMNTVNAIWRRMLPFNSARFRRFLQKPPEGQQHVTHNVNSLLRAGKSIIIHFGKFKDDKDVYTFVTNYIARNLYWTYSRSTEDAERFSWLPHTVLLVEEAHKFVPKNADVGTGGESYFGSIARETRKVGLTVCLIDQRPSKMDDEITSQLNSRVIHRLDDPDDVKAALAGLNKTKWIPIASKLGIGEGLFFGDVVGDVPTMIKPFWSRNLQDVKDYYHCPVTSIDDMTAAIPSFPDDDQDPQELSESLDSTPDILPVEKPSPPIATNEASHTRGRAASSDGEPGVMPPQRAAETDGKGDRPTVTKPKNPGIEKRRSINLSDTSDADRSSL
jgi:hypothetical protein